ncbi:TolC family protein [Hyunsoonleella pacifica]|uniref:TolC family protein n=1 Tax=Hyunsoonleella pacifica TaxID=1080224 RepID=A0A4V2JB13_9FLAO|nr:TolC family protein [Hyunsoonleella pacifica]TBN16453.1 TolC family protein [Hyunsoonleella pacifica]GGD19308.1 transporter [Hyunsoonleella pacifica]
MKKLIRNTIILSICFVGISVFSQQKKWTLLECVNYALENNITVSQNENSILLNEQDVIEAKGQFLPSLGGNIRHNLSIGNRELFPGQFVDRTDNSTSIGVSANQTIFNGFRLTNLYKQSELNLETSKLELSRIKDDISLNVVNSYLNVLFNKERLETAKAQYEFSKKQVEQVKELVDAGTQPKVNIYDAEATLSTDEQSLTIAENNYNLALLTLSQLLQLPFNGFDVEIIEIDNPSETLLYDNVSPIVDHAFENRNEIKVAEKRIENAELGTEISKSGYYPSLTFNYGFGSNAFFTNVLDTEADFISQLNNQKAHAFTLNLGIPIFSRFQNKTAVARSRIQEEQAKLGLEQAKLDLESNIQRAFTDAQAAFKAYNAAKKSLKSQELAFQNAQERYNIGVMNAFELEQSRVRFINAESALINAKYDFVFKTKVLDFYMGKSLTN